MPRMIWGAHSQPLPHSAERSRLAFSGSPISQIAEQVPVSLLQTNPEATGHWYLVRITPITLQVQAWVGGLSENTTKNPCLDKMWTFQEL